MTHPRAPRDGQSGQAMLEFAIVVPVLLTVLMAIFQLGIGFYDYIQVCDAAREAGRAASVSRTTDSGARTTSIRSAAVNTSPGLSSGSLTVNASSTWTQGSDVTVTVSYPYTVSIFGLAVRSVTLTSSSTYRVE